ncbi:acetoacetate--CoA ligase [Candidatus Paracaedibacter symbiosus]|uniref:acetoacetate--CoA ligase n=1 Tax=Candidatus Paracaedibacter symbiosus TaxID=244582 RepID=UPI000509A359|nr:acetoacetate--CoA ligase [Candidatus Paracaedibacter symbiosus]
MRAALKEQPLWHPSELDIKHANLTRFMHQTGFVSYEELYKFSVENSPEFWSLLWDFCDVIASTKGKTLIENKENIEKAQFFPEAKLNFAENLLRFQGSSIAIEFYGEDKVRQTLTHDDLYLQIAKVADTLRSWGIQSGDRIAGYLPNLPHTVIAMLAAASIGAIWSSCSPDFGITGVVDRFGQIEPKVLFCADGYYYHGKKYSTVDKLPEIIKGIPSIEKVVVIPYVNIDFTATDERIFIWNEIIEKSPAHKISFAQLDFNHPLYILFSSGTTGIPKCIIHRAGGALLQLLKEHQLHCDVKPGDRLFYFTTCGWMMWNWLVNGLASGATLILYDGSPAYPQPESLFDIAVEMKFTHFGTSAKFIDSLAKQAVDITTSHDLSSLRMIMSTGSPLAPESFDYVYQHIKKSVCLASISGGTDIVSCFALGNPIAPVWQGELQTPGLAMNIAVTDETGKILPQGKKGELICLTPFPSQPLGFWNDPAGEKYHHAYFAKFPGIWHHGDFVELTPHNGLIIHGRSDAVLNPGGVRIGTAEIYRQVEQINEVLECIAVGQNWNNDVRVVLFVKLKNGIELDELLVTKIKQQIKINTTPRHVPAKIIQITDIPRTKSGKIAEVAVRDTIHGQKINNSEALANPESLEAYKNISELTKD